MVAAAQAHAEAQEAAWRLMYEAFRLGFLTTCEYQPSEDEIHEAFLAWCDERGYPAYDDDHTQEITVVADW